MCLHYRKFVTIVFRQRVRNLFV
uniref:Uncharacterized protein n=1 Tax=Arundo donax TaxID=35708 RepID=A0A0A9AYA3_ARUDO